MRMDRRASSVASHATLKAAEVSADSYQRRLCENDSGEGFGLLGDTIGLGEKGRKLGEDLLNYSLPAISVGSKLLPIENPYLVFRSHVRRVCWARNGR